jgi:1-acyl-sn-glycerol-3-phosphate acyltransferase
MAHSDSSEADTLPTVRLLSDEQLAAIENNTKLTFPVRQSNKSRFTGKLRYWWSWAVAGSMLIVIALPALIILFLINRRLWLYPLALWGAETWLAASGARVRVVGKENIEPGRSYVFVSNHRSYLDTATLFRYAGPRVGIVAKKELLKVPIFGQGMSFANVIAIDRSNPQRALESMEKAKRIVEAGYSFGIFAEGTRAMPGELLPFKKGAFHLSLQTRAAIIPVAIKNTDLMMGKRSAVAYAGEIEMVILPAIETAGRHVPDLLRETRAAIAAELMASSAKEKERA